MEPELAVSVVHDVVVIGAGVIGCALARDLSRLDLKVAILEAGPDCGDGASKGNSALLCTGFDTPRGSLERSLVVRGHQRYRIEGPGMGLPIHQIGALMIACTAEEEVKLQEEFERARCDGFMAVERVDADFIHRKEPHLRGDARAGLWVPGESIVDPFSTPLAFLLDAVANGVRYAPDSPVTAVRRVGGIWHLITPSKTVLARIAINAAGLTADVLDRLAGFDDFEIRPRRGQYILYDKSARSLLKTIVLPTPTETTRGILVTPTVFGNILVGPTAEDVTSPDENQVTASGLAALLAAVRNVLPSLEDHDVVTTFAGMRPATEKPEYRFFNRLDVGWYTVAGVRSTGLSASLGVSEYVTSHVADALAARPKAVEAKVVSVRSLAEGREPIWSQAIASLDLRYREIVCFCENVSLGEIEDAMSSPIPPRSLRALRRRTRVMYGRCQGFFCGARVQTIFDSAGTKP